jgi:hypothetical protein
VLPPAVVEVEVVPVAAVEVEVVPVAAVEVDCCWAARRRVMMEESSVTTSTASGERPVGRCVAIGVRDFLCRLWDMLECLQGRRVRYQSQGVEVLRGWLR